MAGCNGKPDSTPLPVDPRTLVKPTVNANPNAAIQFNAFFIDLHNPPAPYVKRKPPPANDVRRISRKRATRAE